MAYTDVAGDRRILESAMPVRITLAGTVNRGDPIMYSSGFKKSDNTSGAPAILIAGKGGVSGDVITAFGMAVVESTHTAANKPTLGAKVAVQDTGIYGPAGSNLQDVGYVVELDSDNLHSRLLLIPAVTELTTAGS